MVGVQGYVSFSTLDAQCKCPPQTPPGPADLRSIHPTPSSSSSSSSSPAAVSLAVAASCSSISRCDGAVRGDQGHRLGQLRGDKARPGRQYQGALRRQVHRERTKGNRKSSLAPLFLPHPTPPHPNLKDHLFFLAFLGSTLGKHTRRRGKKNSLITPCSVVHWGFSFAMKSPRPSDS